MVNHPTENKGKWDTIDLTKITNGKVKTVAQGVASTKKWHDENPDAYKNGGKISSWEIIEDVPQFQSGGNATSSNNSNTTTNVPFDSKTLSTSGDFSPEEIKKIEDSTIKESEDRIELISNYDLLTPEQQKRYNDQKEIASYNDSLAKYEKAKTDWEKNKSYFTAPKDGIAFPSNYDDLSSFADYCDPHYGCSGAQGRGSTGIIRNGDHSYKIEYFEKPKLSKELENKIKERQKIKSPVTIITNTEQKVPPTVITNIDEKTPPAIIENSTVNSPDKRYFTVTGHRLYRNPRTGAFEPKVFKADGVTGKRLTESYFESDLTASGSTPVFIADNIEYYLNHPDIYRIRTDSSKTWNPETKNFEAKTWIENKTTGESVTDPSFSPVSTTPPESATPPTYTQYGNPSPTVPVSKIKTKPGGYKNGGKILNLSNIKRLPKAQNGITNPPIYVNDPKDPRLQMYSDSSNLYKAYQFQKNHSERNDSDYSAVWDSRDKVAKSKNLNFYNSILESNKLNFKSFADYKKASDDFNNFVTNPNWYNLIKTEPYKSKYAWTEQAAGFKNTEDFKKLGIKSDYDKIKYYESLNFSHPEDVAIGRYSSADIGYKRIKPIGSYWGGKGYNPIYAKPNQPYILQTTPPILPPTHSPGTVSYLTPLFKTISNPYLKKQEEIIPMNVMGLETLIPSQTMQRVPEPNPITSVPKDYVTITTGSSYRNPETGAFEQKTFKIDKVTGKRITEPTFQNGGQTKSNWEILEDTNEDYEYKNGGKTPAWQRKEGKSPTGGLNAKGRASLKKEGHDIKPPQPQGGSRKKSFCARMTGMKKKLTGSKKANDPNSRINLSLKKWKC